MPSSSRLLDPDGLQNGEALLQIEGVSKRFSTLRAVSDVTLSLREGETLGLVGESGSGKTTLALCLVNIYKADTGRILFRGKEVQGLPEHRFRRYRGAIQYLFQDPMGSFNPFYSIGHSLNEYAKLNTDLAPKERRSRIEAELERVGLPARVITSKPTSLSGGQLQRAALARVLLTEPELIILDEPTSALDMSTRGQIITLLQEIQAERHVSYLIISHDLRVVRTMANRVAVMYLGEIVEAADNETLFTAPHHPYTRALLNASEMRHLSSRVTDRDVLHGEVTEMQSVAKGCKLAPRCPYALKSCSTQDQELVSVVGGHTVRCWRTTDISAVDGAARKADPQ